MHYEVKTQLSIVIPNQPGQISKVAEVLSAQRINISGVMFVDTTQQGVVRFIVAEPERGIAALEAAGFFVVAAQVIEVLFSHHIGQLHHFSSALGAAGVNIDYAYGSDNPSPEQMKVIFKVSDITKAMAVIAEL
jgi:hypothetical protein